MSEEKKIEYEHDFCNTVSKSDRFYSIMIISRRFES